MTYLETVKIDDYPRIIPECREIIRLKKGRPVVVARGGPKRMIHLLKEVELMIIMGWGTDERQRPSSIPYFYTQRERH